MIDTKNPQCDPNRFMDELIERPHLKNDAALSRALGVAPPVISKIRHRKLPIGAVILVRAHELTELLIRDIRTWARSVPAEV